MILSGNIWQAESSEFKPGWLEINDGKIVANQPGTFNCVPDFAPAGFIAPGFVDVHSHGGGGADFSGGVAAARTVLAAHRKHGITTMIASLVTDSIAALSEQVAALSELVHSGELAGIHLEGPWISPAYKGAHDLEKLTQPSATAVEQLLNTEPGLIRMVTLAPELDGAMAAISILREAGIVAALGHTAADFKTATAAFRAGATGITHLFNAMPELAKRDPGLVLAGFCADTVWLELIFDTYHVDKELAAFVCRTFPDRVVLISDAMAATGMGDGDYSLGGLPVRVTGSVARLVSNAAIAGSTITLQDALCNAVACGIPVGTAVRFVTLNPANYLGLTDVGRLTPGSKANLVVLDETGKVCEVISPAG
ncbi:MAG: amidohydrolase family protein [Propionibacteriaceae bacterium]|nr:amidohydrolase family protein [Propionibacteriaceae bacterium]